MANVLSSVFNRLSELVEKVDLIWIKPFVMTCEKEELLNAAVPRVDASEAELIATKEKIGFAGEGISVRVQFIGLLVPLRLLLQLFITGGIDA